MPPSFDPRQIPVTGIDTDLPAIDPGRLSGAALRRRFQTTLEWFPEIVGDPRRATRQPADASVLIAVVLRDEPTILLTQRTDHLKDHAGQISFPGGRAESHDADAVATALREAHEEIGLRPDEVDVLGTLPTYVTITNFVVTPVVGLVEPGFTLSIEPGEVAEAFEVPLHFLMSPSNHRRHTIVHAEGSREFLSMPWPGISVEGQEREYFIWGATAAMLRNLYRFLAA